jgi:hypothetical protein
MAARKHGRILSSIWDDDDFRVLEESPQRMYMFLVSQPDLEQSGVIPLRERRWARSAAGLTADRVNAALQVLESTGFVVIDEDTEELLVRSLIRRDNVWKQPNVFKSAADQIHSVSSRKIRGALHEELSRLDLDTASQEVQRIRDELVNHLEPFAKGSGNPSGTPDGTPRGGQPKGSREAPGKGIGNGPVVKDSPTPSPIPGPGAPHAQARATLRGVLLLDEHLKACAAPVPRDVKQRTGTKIDALLEDGFTDEQIRAGLALMRSRPGKGPGLLSEFVHEAATIANSGNVTPLRSTGTDGRFAPGSGQMNLPDPSEYGKGKARI